MPRPKAGAFCIYAIWWLFLSSNQEKIFAILTIFDAGYNVSP